MGFLAGGGVAEGHPSAMPATIGPKTDIAARCLLPVLLAVEREKAFELFFGGVSAESARARFCRELTFAATSVFQEKNFNRELVQVDASWYGGGFLF